MDLSKIISISGKAGLFKVVGDAKNGMIVESLDDGKRFPAFSTHQVSTLEDISIYSDSEDVPLGEVFEKIHAKSGGKKAPDHQSAPDVLKAFFEEAFPKYDSDRVYASDIKKVIKWYNILIEKGLLKPDKKETKKENKPAPDTDESKESENDNPEKEQLPETKKDSIKDNQPAPDTAESKELGKDDPKEESLPEEEKATD